MFAAYVCVVLAALAAADAKKIVPIIEKPTPAVDPIDCSRVGCALPKCEPGYRATTVDGKCCPSCEPCPFPLLRCPMIVCSSLVYNKDDPCACPECIMDWEEKDPTKRPPVTDTLPPPTKPPTDPTRETTDPTRETTDPTRETTDPTRETTDPTRETTDSTRETTDPTRETTDPTREITETTRHPTKPTRETTDPTREITDTTEPPMCDVEGQVFTEYGSFCPPVCGEAMLAICTLPYVVGCQCPRGTMLDKASNRCVTECPTAPPTIATPDRCNLEPDVGRCKARITRYYYNAASGQCTLFAYGGCGGNTNNFRTPKECQDTCMIP